MIAFIPARMGSKRIPNKNIKDFFGSPIINYTIQSVIDSNLFDEIIISTDNIYLLFDSINIINDRINIIKRSEELVSDNTILYDTLIDFVRQKDYNEKYICLLYPCAPFITAKRLIDGYKEIKKDLYDVVFPITKSNIKVQQLLQKVDTKKVIFKKDLFNNKVIGKKVQFNKVKMLYPNFNNINSNNWSDTYQHSSQWFWCSTKKLFENKTLVPVNSGYIELPWYESQDIDTIDDWKIAELKYKYFMEQNE